MKDRAVFDAHAHAVDPDVGRFPRRRPDFPAAWLADHARSADDLVDRLVANDVDGALLVQPQGAYGFDNRYVLEAATRSPMLAAVVSVDVTRPDRVDAVESVADAGAVGIRLFSIPTPDDRWLADPATFAAWEACRDRSLVVSVGCLPIELAALARVASTFPDVAIVLDHCGFVDLVSDATTLAEVADRPNVHLKVTGHVLHELAERGADPAAAVQALVALVGADRLLWGSDWPQTGLSYRHSVAAAEQATAGLSPTAADHILGATAQRLHRQSMV